MCTPVAKSCEMLYIMKEMDPKEFTFSLLFGNGALNCAVPGPQCIAYNELPDKMKYDVLMQNCGTSSLKSVQKTLLMLPQKECLDNLELILGKLALYVQKMHLSGSSHCDLKCSNLLMSGSGPTQKSVLIDFEQILAFEDVRNGKFAMVWPPMVQKYTPCYCQAGIIVYQQDNTHVDFSGFLNVVFSIVLLYSCKHYFSPYFKEIECVDHFVSQIIKGPVGSNRILYLMLKTMPFISIRFAKKFAIYADKCKRILWKGEYYCNVSTISYDFVKEIMEMDILVNLSINVQNTCSTTEKGAKTSAHMAKSILNPKKKIKTTKMFNPKTITSSLAYTKGDIDHVVAEII